MLHEEFMSLKETGKKRKFSAAICRIKNGNA